MRVSVQEVWQFGNNASHIAIGTVRLSKEP